jgi:hypothetical protein
MNKGPVSFPCTVTLSLILVMRYEHMTYTYDSSGFTTRPTSLLVLGRDSVFLCIVLMCSRIKLISSAQTRRLCSIQFTSILFPWTSPATHAEAKLTNEGNSAPPYIGYQIFTAVVQQMEVMFWVPALRCDRMTERQG